MLSLKTLLVWSLNCGERYKQALFEQEVETTLPVMQSGTDLCLGVMRTVWFLSVSSYVMHMTWHKQTFPLLLPF